MVRELNEDDRKDLRNRFLDGIQRGLVGDPGQTLSGQPVPEFLAGPEPTSPLPAWQWKSGRAICDRWARGDRTQILPGRDLFYRNLCEPYLDTGMPGDPEFNESFPTGQCSGVTYVVGTKGEVCPDGPTDVSAFASGPGPISSITRELIPDNPAPGLFRFRWTVVFSDTSRQFTLVRTSPSPEPCVRTFRSDGLPDECGTPSEEFDAGEPNPTPDPNPGPVGGPTGFPFPGFDVTVNPDGTITIEFGDGSEPVTIDPGIPGAPAGDGGLPPGDIGAAGDPVDSGAGDEAEGEAPPGEVLVGLAIVVLDSPPSAKVFSGDVFRAIGYVYMGVPGQLALHPSGSTHRETQFTFAEKDNLTAWKVLANSGYNLRVTPYYREVEE